MGMATGRYFIDRIRNNGRGGINGFHTVQPNNGGFLLVGMFRGDYTDTYISVLPDHIEFVVKLPVGNKIPSTFFSPDDRLEIAQFLSECRIKAINEGMYHA